MRLLVLLSAFFLSAAPARAEESKKLELIRKIPHTGYSEGLDWKDGFLWHTTPQETLKIDPADGQVVERHPPFSPYNESPLWVAGQLLVFSYHDDGIYAGTRKGEKFEVKRVGSVPEVKAWGSTFDGKHIVVTGDHNSPKLYFLDPKTFRKVREITTPVPDLEDLAWDGQGLWTSSFTQHKSSIFRVDPKTGAIGSLYVIPEPEACPIVDGLAFDGKTLWITGKNCPAIWNVKLPTERKVSSRPNSR